MLFVSVALIVKGNNVLVTQRHPDKHQGSLWEFPGGKVESGETPYDALVREISEEVALDILSATQVQTIDHDYGDQQVRLIIFRVDDFHGEAVAQEGQPLRWQPLEKLSELGFPEANKKIFIFNTLS